MDRLLVSKSNKGGCFKYDPVNRIYFYREQNLKKSLLCKIFQYTFMPNE